MKSPLPTTRRFVLLCGAVPVLVAALLALYRPSSLTRFDHGVYDMLLRTAPTKRPDQHVVIVDVDERSLSEVGQWPWRRDLVARLISRLRELGAAAIALDVIFAEPDRDSGTAPSHARNGGRGATPDETLAETLRQGGVILGYGMTFDGDPPANACVLHPLNLAIFHRQSELEGTPYFEAAGVICSLPMLGQAAGASGFLNAAPDTDGILRRVPVVIEHDGRVYPSLALAAVAAACGASHATLDVSNVNAASLTLGPYIIRLDGKSNLLVRFRGKKKTLAYVSAADVLAGRVEAGRMRGRIAFVGTTALGTREVVATPLDTLFTGVEVQGTVADNLLQQDSIQRSPIATIVESVTVLALGFTVAGLLAAAGMVAGVVAAGGGMALMWAGAGWLLSTSGVLLSPLYPMVGIVGTLATTTLAKSVVERRRAENERRGKTTAQRLMVQTLLSLTETRDAETGRHSRRTQEYARLLAEQLSQHPEYRDYLTRERIEVLSSLAPLHDIGKVGIPDHILNKPGALTREELVEMQKHPVYGRDVILRAEQQVGVRDDAILTMAKDIVYTHHERWDGTGYPQGLRGEGIPIPGRVMAIVDVYDALTTRSLYHPPMSHDEAVQFIVRGTGTHFDPAVVDAFLSAEAALKRVAHELAES